MAGTELFHISFTANEDVLLSDVLQVSSRYTKAEAYNGNLYLMDVQFRFEGEATITDEVILYQNQPNPFKATTVIGFELPKATTATLSIYDISGRTLMLIEGDYSKGYHEVSIDKRDLQGSGVLYYQLVTPDFEATKKMMMMVK